MTRATVQLPLEGDMPALSTTATWFNSQPLTPGELRGRVVLVNFCTYTCINWIRTLPWLRAWSDKYRDKGLVLVGVHTPEFAIEKDAENVRRALQAMRVDYPVVMDNDYSIWNSFNNFYWPALYFVDANGHIRHHAFGEGEYGQSEVAIQRLLSEAGFSGFEEDLVSVDGRGIEAAADWSTLKSPETYVGYGRTENFASPGGQVPDTRHVYAAPGQLRLNHWNLTGDWTIQREAAVLNVPEGAIAFRFHARDLHLVMGPADRDSAIRFRVMIDGQAPGNAHGADIDDLGEGTATEQRLYQLIRQRGPVSDMTFEISFLDPGAIACVFTFG